MMIPKKNYAKEELCQYTLSEDFSNEDAVEIGKFSKTENGDWQFTAVGIGHEGGIVKLISKYAYRF